MLRQFVTLEPGPELIERVRSYRKLVNKLFSGSAKLADVESQYQRVIELLRDPRLCSAALEARILFADDFGPEQDFFKHEARILSNSFGTSLKSSERIIFGSSVEGLSDLRDPIQEFLNAFAAAHADVLAKYESTKSDERREKKAKRKRIRAGVEYICSGVVVFAANGCTNFFDAYKSESLTLGVGMVLKGCYDIRQVA